MRGVAYHRKMTEAQVVLLLTQAELRCQVLNHKVLAQQTGLAEGSVRHMMAVLTGEIRNDCRRVHRGTNRRELAMQELA